MDELKTYEFRPTFHQDTKCFKVNCLYFEKKHNGDGSVERVQETCGINSEIICDDLSSVLNTKETITAKEFEDFIKITHGYSQHPEYTLESTVCPNFRLFFNIENTLLPPTRISGMTLKFFNFIKEQILYSNRFEIEVILLLFRRILSLENFIERYEINTITVDQLREVEFELSKLKEDYRKVVKENEQLKNENIQKPETTNTITIDQLMEMGQTTSRIEAMEFELSRLKEDYRKVVKENEQLKNENIHIQKPEVIKKISEYIKQVFKRVNNNPGEYISEQDLLQILVYLED